jgi:WD40 repeat protein
MKNSVRQSKVKLVNPITKLPTEQFIAHNLRERKDLIKDKSFLRCSIQHWDRFIKLCDEQLAIDLLHFICMLIFEVMEEVGTSESLLCQSDNDDFTISPNGNSLVASFIDYTYKVWDTTSWKLQRVFECDDTVFQFSPNGQKFVTYGGGSHEPAVWDFNSGRKLFNLSNPQLIDRLAIDFDPSGIYIVAGSGDANAITFYDAKTGKPLRELAMGATNLVFSPNGTKLASVHQDKISSEVIIWDISQP